MLVLTCIMGLKTKSTDFRNAFAQVELNHPVYLQPQAKYYDASWGENTIIGLNKSLYGHAEAPRLWHEKFKEGSEKCGFTLSKV